MSVGTITDTFASHYVDAGGIRTHYLDEGSGPAVILLHGGGAGADAYCNWRAIIPPLARHFRTIAVDMVGFGKTDVAVWRRGHT